MKIIASKFDPTAFFELIRRARRVDSSADPNPAERIRRWKVREAKSADPGKGPRRTRRTGQ